MDDSDFDANFSVRDTAQKTLTMLKLGVLRGDSSDIRQIECSGESKDCLQVAAVQQQWWSRVLVSLCRVPVPNIDRARKGSSYTC